MKLTEEQRTEAMKRLLSHRRVDARGCHRWTLAKDSFGYGRVTFKGQKTKAHRLIMTAIHGEIPKGMVVDHLCHTRDCFNPAHLRICTPGENARNFNPDSPARSNTGVRGVRFESRNSLRPFKTSVVFEAVGYSAGSFATLEEASAAVSALRERLWGSPPSLP